MLPSITWAHSWRTDLEHVGGRALSVARHQGLEDMPSPFSAPHDIKYPPLGNCAHFILKIIYIKSKNGTRIHKNDQTKRTTCFFLWFFWVWKQVTGQATWKYQRDNIRHSWWISEIPGFETFAVFFLTLRAFLVYKSWIMALSTWTWRHSPVPGDGWVQGTCLWAGDPAGGRVWPFMTLKPVQNSEEMKLKVKESQR